MNTWGISGPAFLALYTALLAATVVAVMVADRRDGRRRPSAKGLALDQYEVALLNGDDQLAASVALLELDRAGAVELGDRLLRDLADANELDLDHLTDRQLDQLGVGMEITLLGDVPAGAHPVEAAVHRAVRKSDNRTPYAVIRSAGRSRQFAALREGLVAKGLLRSPAELTGQGRRWLFFLPVLVLGAVRLVYGIRRDKPVLFLVLLLLVAGAAAIATARHRSDRTSLTKDVLKDLRRTQPDPYEAIEAAESADPRRPAHLGMALALAGTAPLWGASPALAAAIGAPSAVEPTKWWQAGGDWGGGWGWAPGGDGGGGGGGGCGGGGGGGGGGCGG